MEQIALISIGVLAIVAGVAKAIMDTLQFHFPSSIFKGRNDLFWNPAKSWRNKYKDDVWLEPKFLFSTTILVWTTDAWHLFQMVFLLSIHITLGVALLSEYALTETVLVVIGYGVLFRGSFFLFYNKFLLRKGLKR